MARGKAASRLEPGIIFLAFILARREGGLPVFISSFPREWVKLETSFLIFFFSPPLVTQAERHSSGILHAMHRPRFSRRA